MEALLSDGILVVDKPEDISSARVVARVKGCTGARKVGHAGTLDPFATGVLVCCINQATKLSRFFLHSDKRYAGILRLGTETDTLDRTGTVVATGDVTAVTEADVHHAAACFQGEIEQIPPAYSALKHNGVPLYRLARQGKPVQKPPRAVTIHRLVIERIELPDVHFSVACSAGTYIRTLAADIGRMIGCGAHLRTLRRTASGRFTLDTAVPLAELDHLQTAGQLADRLISLSGALADMPRHEAGPDLARQIGHGRPVTGADIPLPEGGGQVRVVDRRDRLLAVLRRKKMENTYDYCCVFNQNRGNT